MSYPEQPEYWNDDHEYQYDDSNIIHDEPPATRSFDEDNYEGNHIENELTNSSSTEEMDFSESESESSEDSDYVSEGEKVENFLEHLDERMQNNYETIIQKYSTRPTSLCVVNLFVLGLGILVTALYTKECYSLL